MSSQQAEIRAVLKELREILAEALEILDSRKELKKHDAVRAAA